ncbi:Retrovirus-related Pol polyprotein from transposon opus [Dictyocoela roeselum]|nr:Retrovirus-related Pol polyprotein from transposon opus [Dictyocoela roeselum]
MKYFSVLDLKDGYFQVPLCTEDREKTTFLDADNRLLQFKKMPQGYKNSPAIFQIGMAKIFEGLNGKICHIYLDDILIFGEDEARHDENLELIMDRLNKFGLAINQQK